MSAGLSGMAEGSAEFFYRAHFVLIFVRNGIFRAYLGREWCLCGRKSLTLHLDRYACCGCSV